MMLRRLKEDVEKNLAPKEETIIEVLSQSCEESKNVLLLLDLFILANTTLFKLTASGPTCTM